MSEAHILYGFHAVLGRLRQGPAGVREIWLDRARNDARARELARIAGERGVRLVLVESARLDGMTRHAPHQGVLARVDSRAPLRDLESVLEGLPEAPLLLVLDGVTDPHNLGACLRVADALRAHAVIAPKDRAAGINPTVAKVASGAVDTVPFLPVTNLARAMRELKERGIWLMGADEAADADIYSLRLDGPVAWVLGAEGEGMRRLTRESCDELARIPMLGSVTSLNVAVTAGICLAETRRQREKWGRGRSDE
ncbi:MAG: 23S rRNA (guanosine(2251)-2'-O)-methyltransferase RlmB [Burkholderiales bacterium]|nr:23S rRNA (guanosine(2251)-2'-O)-methyltransferase RlmB [Burkholderiales bacterium]